MYSSCTGLISCLFYEHMFNISTYPAPLWYCIEPSFIRQGHLALSTTNLAEDRRGYPTSRTDRVFNNLAMHFWCFLQA